MKPYEVLRNELRKHGYSGTDVARWFDLMPSSISSRMTGHTPWSIDEIYTIMDKLELVQRLDPKFAKKEAT